MTRTSKIVLLVMVLAAVGAYFVLGPRAPVDRVDSGPAPAPSAAATPSTNPGGSEDFAPLLAERLAALAARDHLVAHSTGNMAVFEHGSIALATRLEHDDSEKDGGRGIGIAVTAAIPDSEGTFQFTTGAVGVGHTRAQAIDQAVAGWLGLAGKALLEAVPRRATSTVALPFGAFTAYPGSLAVRGEGDLHWNAGRDQALLAAVASELGGLAPGSSHSVALSITVLGGSAIDGQCLIDDRAAEALCKVAQKFDWPGSSDGYFARQVYLLRPRTTATPR